MSHKPAATERRGPEGRARQGSGSGGGGAGSSDTSDGANVVSGLIGLAIIGFIIHNWSTIVLIATIVFYLALACAVGGAVYALSVAKPSTRRILIWVYSAVLLVGGTMYVANQQRAVVRAREQERIIAEQRVAATERQRQIDALKVAERGRVNREAEGIWTGPNEVLTSFSAPSEHVRAPLLRIARTADGFVAVLRTGLIRVTYEGQVVDRERRNEVEAMLLLTPRSVTGDLGPSRNPGFYQQTVVVSNGDSARFGGTTPYGGVMSIALTRVKTIVSEEAVEAFFAERRVEEIERFPTSDLRLFDEPGDYTWDDLRLSELKTGGLRVFDTGLWVSAAGGRYHHVVIRGPEGTRRKAWIRASQ